MQAVPGMDPTPSLAYRSGSAAEIWTGQVVSIGRWMVVLGIIRLISALFAWNVEIVRRLDSGPALSSSLASVGGLLVEHPPVVALGMIWIVVLGVLVSRVHWPELLRVSTVVFFVLAASGLMTFILGWRFGSDHFIAIGSFMISRSALVPLTQGGVIVALLGTVQLAAELYVAGRSAWILRESRRQGWPVAAMRTTIFEEMAPRTRSLVCQVCWVVSLASLVPVVRPLKLPKVSTVLSASPMLRNLLLMADDSGPRRDKPPAPTPEIQEEERTLRRLVVEAAKAWQEHRYEAASKAYQQVISIYRTSAARKDQQSRNNLALLANNFAWMLATRPDPRPGDPEKAVENARLAVATNPSQGTFWNTLGAAQYRAKNWQGAKNALMRSMELRGDGDGYDWILFALLYAQTGPKSHAMEWYQKAARWRKDFGPWELDLYVFESEAAERLGLPKPPIPSPMPSFYDDDRRDLSRFGGGILVNPDGEDSRFSRRHKHRLGR
jgi:hypothetical protein